MLPAQVPFLLGARGSGLEPRAGKLERRGCLRCAPTGDVGSAAGAAPCEPWAACLRLGSASVGSSAATSLRSEPWTQLAVPDPAPRGLSELVPGVPSAGFPGASHAPPLSGFLAAPPPPRLRCQGGGGRPTHHPAQCQQSSTRPPGLWGRSWAPLLSLGPVCRPTSLCRPCRVPLCPGEMGREAERSQGVLGGGWRGRRPSLPQAARSRGGAPGVSALGPTWLPALGERTAVTGRHVPGGSLWGTGAT